MIYEIALAVLVTMICMPVISLFMRFVIVIISFPVNHQVNWVSKSEWDEDFENWKKEWRREQDEIENRSEPDG